MTKEELEEVKNAACVIVGDQLGHFVDKHIVSEREQELLENFAGACQNTIRTLFIPGETES